MNLSAYSNIGQFDGIDSIADLSQSFNDNTSDDNSDISEIDTDDEFEPETTPISLTPKTKPNKRQTKILKASSLPLITVLNARSLYNKNLNFKKFMTELGIEAAIVSERLEWEDKPLADLLNMA